MLMSIRVPPAHRHLSLQRPRLLAEEKKQHTDNQRLLHGAGVLRGMRSSYSVQGLW